MRYLLLFLACCLASAGAHGQTGVPDVIKAYRAITVTYSTDAKDCNLEHTATYAARLGDRLAAIGVHQSDASYLSANISIAGQKIGLLGGRCITLVELMFGANLSKDNIVTSDPNVRAAIDRLGVFPIVIYKNTQFSSQAQEQPAAGGKSVTARNAALGMIDRLVTHFASQRK